MSSNGETQRPPRVDKALLDRFKADVKDRHGRLRGNYSSELENAIEAYLDASDGGDTNDRLARLEQQVGEIHGEVCGSGQKNKNGVSDTSSTTEKRLANIKASLRTELDGSVKAHNEVVEKTIRDHAGSSKPTLRRYKKLLKQDRELFQHPNKEHLYFRDAEDYVLAVNAMAKAGKVEQQQYDELVEEFGEDWWLEQQEDGSDKGFQ